MLCRHTTGAAVLLTAAMLCAQPADLELNPSDYHSPAEAGRWLQAKTGWQVSIEEPLWPVLAR